MNFAAAFNLFKDDPAGLKKLAIGTGLLFTGLGTIPLFGWCVAVARRAQTGTTPALPEWTPFGPYVITGLKFVGILLLWQLPVLCILPFPALSEVAAVREAVGESNVLWLSLAPMLLCLTPYALGLSLLAPPMFGTLAATGSFGAALNPLVLFQQWRRNPLGHLTALVVSCAIIPFLALGGMVVCFVGIYPALVYGYALQAHLCGQAYRPAPPASDGR